MQTAETGRFPLSIDINIHIKTYWIKMIHSNPDSLIFTVYKEFLRHHNVWISHVKHLLNSTGYDIIIIWEKQDVDNVEVFKQI